MRKLISLYIKLSFIIIYSLVSQTSNAGFISGNDLYKDLDRDIKGGAGYAEGHSSGYITGVADAFDGVIFCLPGNVTIRQVKHVVYNYMRDNPADWNKAGDLNIVNALKQTWPCKKI